jgi:hypothetical protein
LLIFPPKRCLCAKYYDICLPDRKDWTVSIKCSYWEIACFHDKLIKIKSLEKNKKSSFEAPSARFGTSETCAVSSTAELFRYVPKGLCRAEPMQFNTFLFLVEKLISCHA